MKTLITELGNRQALYKGLNRLSDTLLSYMDNPSKALQDLKTFYSGVNDLESVKEIENIQNGLNGSFTIEHATGLGRQFIIKEIKQYELNIQKEDESLRNSFKLESATIRDKVSLLFSVIELNNPLRNIEGIKNNKLMSNYFNSKLENIERSELLAVLSNFGINRSISSLNSIQLFTVLPVLFDKALEIYSKELTSAIDLFRDKENILRVAYDGRAINGPEQVKEKYGDFDYITPRKPFLDQAIAEATMPANLPATAIDAFANFINYMVMKLPIIKENADLLCNCLDRLSDSEFKLFNTVLQNLLYQGLYKFEKPEITEKDMRDIQTFDYKYLDKISNVEMGFVKYLERAVNRITSLCSLFVKYNDIVYRCFSKVL